MPHRHNTLTIPPGTKLLSIERLPEVPCDEWAIWIYTNAEELKKPHNERQGTYLRLNVDGSVDRITVDGDRETVLPVMD